MYLVRLNLSEIMPLKTFIQNSRNLGPVYMEWGTPVEWGWFLLFSRSGGHKTKETYPTRPGSTTPCKQGLRFRKFLLLTSRLNSLPLTMQESMCKILRRC